MYSGSKLRRIFKPGYVCRHVFISIYTVTHLNLGTLGGKHKSQNIAIDRATLLIHHAPNHNSLQVKEMESGQPEGATVFGPSTTTFWCRLGWEIMTSTKTGSDLAPIPNRLKRNNPTFTKDELLFSGNAASGWALCWVLMFYGPKLYIDI